MRPNLFFTLCNPDSVFATDYARDAQPPLSEEGSGIRVKSPK
jgi:hypothetical protein